MMIERTVLIMAAGTGGHIYPGIAVGTELSKRGCKIVWLGTKIGLENNIVSKYNFKLYKINFEGIRKKGLFKLFFSPFRLISATIQCLILIKKLKPNLVLGFGGYVSLPGSLASYIMKKPLIIHEQNTIPGFSNKISSIFAKKVLTGFPLKLEKSIYVGNPVRNEISDISKKKENDNMLRDNLRILIFGGSQGASFFNRFLPSFFVNFYTDKKIRILHQVGKKDIEIVKKMYKRGNLDAKVVQFIEEMEQAYLDADLVISRAGALTVAEISCVGVASILIPYPYAVDNHQVTNAKFLADKGAAILLDQKDVNKNKLNKILNFLNESEIKKMSEKAKSLGFRNSTRDIANICEEFLKK